MPPIALATVAGHRLRPFGFIWAGTDVRVGRRLNVVSRPHPRCHDLVGRHFGLWDREQARPLFLIQYAAMNVIGQANAPGVVAPA